MHCWLFLRQIHQWQTQKLARDFRRKRYQGKQLGLEEENCFWWCGFSQWSNQKRHSEGRQSRMLKEEVKICFCRGWCWSFERAVYKNKKYNWQQQHTRARAHTHTHIRTHAHTCMHARTHTYTNIYTRTHTHTCGKERWGRGGVVVVGGGGVETELKCSFIVQILTHTHDYCGWTAAQEAQIVFMTVDTYCKNKLNRYICFMICKGGERERESWADGSNILYYLTWQNRELLRRAAPSPYYDPLPIKRLYQFSLPHLPWVGGRWSGCQRPLRGPL